MTCQAVLALLLLAGCRGDNANQRASASAPVGEVIEPKAPAPKTTPPVSKPSPSPIPADATQLIVTVTENWAGTSARLYRFTRDKGEWLASGPTFSASVGYAGLAWGVGIHPADAPTPDAPTKVEGDGKSPAGIFLLGDAYGYDKRFSGTSELPYQQVDRKWRCVNDSASTLYNRVFDSKTVMKKDWSSAERMRRNDELYRLVVAVGHNHLLPGDSDPIAEAGSCIFLHVWGGDDSPTVGCTAMSLTHMEDLISWLKPSPVAVLVALPRPRYEALQSQWGLPSLP